MLNLTTELSFILHHNLHLLLALTALLPTLMLVRTWCKAISLAVALFCMPREFFTLWTFWLYVAGLT